MRVLVTGASGMLGAATAQAVAAAGHHVTVYQRRPSALPFHEVRGDITDRSAVYEVMAGMDAVVHLAARVSITGDEREFERVNVGGTELALEAARATGVGRFVYVSSPSVVHTGSPIMGADAMSADPANARGHYSRTKARAELLALAADSPGFAVTSVRPHLVWGPGDTQLIGRIVARARAGRLFLIDHGQALIDTTYVANAASALAAAVERVTDEGVHGQAFIVTNGQPRTVAEMLTRIAASAGYPAPNRSVGFGAAMAAGRLVEVLWSRRSAEPPLTGFLVEQLATAHWFDQSRTRMALKWQPTVGIDEGFELLSAWYSRGVSASDAEVR